MKKMKLEVSEKLKQHLEEMNKVLSKLVLDDDQLAKIIAGDGCGGVCRVTCSYFCRPSCEATCRSDCTNTCYGACEVSAYMDICPNWVVKLL